MKKEPISLTSLIISIISLIIGCILCFNSSEGIFKFIGYTVSGILIIVGIVKMLLYYRTKKKFPDYASSDALTGGMITLFGILIAIFPESISITISILIGGIVLFSGISRLILGLSIKQIDQSGSKIFTWGSVLMIILGVIIISGKFINLLGFFIVIYSVSSLVGYIYYTSQNKDYSEVINNKKVTKDMKNKEAREAVIEEDK